MADGVIKYHSMKRDELRSLLTNKLYCSYSKNANKEDLINKIRDYIIAYNKGTLFDGGFDAYCDHSL